MLFTLPHVISSVTHFTRSLRRSQQGLPVGRSQLYHIFSYRFSLFLYFVPIMHLCSTRSYSQRNQHLSQALGRHRLKYAQVTQLGIFLLFGKEELHKINFYAHLFLCFDYQRLMSQRENPKIYTVQSVGTRYMVILRT